MSVDNDNDNQECAKNHSMPSIHKVWFHLLCLGVSIFDDPKIPHPFFCTFSCNGPTSLNLVSNPWESPRHGTDMDLPWPTSINLDQVVDRLIKLKSKMCCSSILQDLTRWATGTLVDSSHRLCMTLLRPTKSCRFPFLRPPPWNRAAHLGAARGWPLNFISANSATSPRTMLSVSSELESLHVKRSGIPIQFLPNYQTVGDVAK